MPPLSETLLQAYHQTDYWCVGLDGEGPISLRIGEPQPALALLYTVFNVQCAAFITACNPLGRALSEAENALRQDRLKADLAQRGFSHLKAEGRPLLPGWKPEASWLIPGMLLADAMRLGAVYQQNAIIWVGPDMTPQLHTLV